MLVARLRPENPRGAARITYDARDTVFVLEGVGEITSAKLLDLENRQQLVWLVDEQTRVQVRAAAMLRARQDAADRAAARTRTTPARRTVPPRTSSREVGSPPAAAPSGESAGAANAPRLEEVGRRSPRRRTTLNAGQRRRLAAGALAALICVAVTSAGVLAWSRAAGLLTTVPAARETRYTELYFTSPAALPIGPDATETDPISFTVFNHEGRRRVYSYTVRLSGPSGSSLIARGSMDLDSNTGQARLVRLTPTWGQGAYSVTVTVAEPLLSISFTGTS